MLKVNSNFTRGGQTYQTPSVNVLDVLSEGVLCSSLDPGAEDWEPGKGNWFEEQLVKF